MPSIEELNPRIGLLGELAVEIEIVKQGWHPVRLDTAQMASNADLIAVNRRRRVAIQVKTTNAEKSAGGAARLLTFGYATGYLRDNQPVFNAKNSPLIADIVVAVSYSPQNVRFIVLPIALAETLCRIQCDYWSCVPTKAGKKRSMSFPISLPFGANLNVHKDHYGRLRKTMLRFEDAWNILSEEIGKLHDPKKWPLLK